MALLVSAYAAVVLLVHLSGFIARFGKEAAGEREWWVVALRLVNELVPTTLYLLPLAVSTTGLFENFKESKKQLARPSSPPWHSVC